MGEFLSYGGALAPSGSPVDMVREMIYEYSDANLGHAEVHTIEPLEWHPGLPLDVTVLTKSPDEEFYREALEGRIYSDHKGEVIESLARVALDPSEVEVAALTKLLNDRQL